MKALYDEVISRFPEADAYLSEDNRELPYLVMGAIPCWLATLKPAGIDKPLIKRLQDFRTWCLAQPRTEEAGTDVLTIYTVSFFEDLFEHETTRLFIPYLVEKEDLIQGADYLKTWVGEDNYKLALASFGQTKKLSGRKRKKK
ncbi:MAG: hypothetical protein ACAI35_11905 [Candidatus Methylacidiphilales bacterium]